MMDRLKRWDGVGGRVQEVALMSWVLNMCTVFDVFCVPVANGRAN